MGGLWVPWRRLPREPVNTTKQENGSSSFSAKDTTQINLQNTKTVPAPSFAAAMEDGPSAFVRIVLQFASFGCILAGAVITAQPLLILTAANIKPSCAIAELFTRELGICFLAIGICIRAGISLRPHTEVLRGLAVLAFGISLIRFYDLGAADPTLTSGFNIGEGVGLFVAGAFTLVLSLQ